LRGIASGVSQLKTGNPLREISVPRDAFGPSGIPAARVPVLLALALAVALLGAAAADPVLRLSIWFVALTLAMLALTILGMGLRQKHLHRLRGAAFDALVKFDDDAVFLSDRDGLIERSNGVAYGLFPLAPGEHAGRFLAFLVAAPDELFCELRQGALAAGRAQRRLTHLKGAPLLVLTRVGLDGLLWRLTDQGADGAQSLLGGAVLNVAAAPLARDTDPSGVTALTTAHNGGPYREQVLEELPVPILRIARDGTVEQANRRARQLLEEIDVVGQSLSAIVEGLGRPIREWLNDAYDGRGLHRPEVVRMTPGNVDLYLQITLGQIGAGDDMRLVAVLHDATEMKTLEAQFVQSQKMQAIGQLAGGVAHDFNNLLTAISGHCDLLLLRRDEMDPDFADLEQINQNANRAASLVGQLLAFSRKQNLRPEYLDLRLTLADLTHLLNRLVGEKVHLYYSHDPALQAIRADKRQLEQVIMNLVVNARDAMPAGGRIDIETQVETLTEPLCRDRVIVPAGVYVAVRVCDEGTGIAPDKLPKIFEPFFTTKKTGEGTGLGLSTAYGIVKQTGGFIFADSVLGEGSRFTLYFPAHLRGDPGLGAAPAPAPDTPSTPRDGVVLLVEDEAPVRAFACRALRLRGYTVIEAGNGEEALSILADLALRVDIFVTDVIMPGLDGPSWVKQALVARPATKVIFVSGYSEENLSETQASILNSVFLPKPFSLTQLTTTVQEQLS